MSHERRSLQRLNANRQILIETLNRNGLRIQASMRNYSAKGLCVSLGQHLPAGTLVSLNTEGLLMLGEVVWCQPTGDGYQAGIELEHLLDTDELQVLIAGL